MVDARLSRSDIARRLPAGAKQRFATALFADRRRPPRPPAREFGETAVRAVGVALAIGSTAFAAFMISDAERKPQFAGIEHLAIYSRPTVIAAQRAQTQVADQRSKVDYTPVGSIAEQQEPTIPGFLLLEVRSGAALVQTPNSIVRVSPGDVLAGLGRITSFERRGEKWVVVTQSGIVVGN